MTSSLHSLIDVRLHWAECHTWAAGQQVQQDWLPAYCVWLGVEGVVETISIGRRWSIGRGDALLFPAGAARVIETPNGAEWITIGLSASSPGQNNLLELLPAPCSWRVADDDDAIAVLVNQLVAQPEASGASTLVSEGLSRALFGVMWQQLATRELNEAAGANLPDWLGAALANMRATPEKSVGEVAREVGISPSQLRRGFHEFLETSPREYARRQRLEAARHALENTETPIHAVAEACGFSSAALFSRAIKTEFGLAPLELRRAAREPAV